MKENLQIIETILERDIDILLLEEFNTNHNFLNWFINYLDLPNLSSNNGTWRSISDFGLGETDLLLSYNSNENTIYVLIENKLDADFQNLQFERYQKRGQIYKNEQKCNEFYTILIAPKLYAENQNEFEKYFTYEDFEKFLIDSKDERLLFKSKLVRIAIEKSKRGYQPINCEPVQLFWKNYYEYKQTNFPNLKMKKPTIVPLGSDWIELRNEDLKGIIFYHKLGKGFIDATFCNFSIEVEYHFKDILPTNYYFEKHKSGRFSIRQNIAEIDRTKYFNSQIETVKIGLTKIDEIKNWIKLNLNEFSLNKSIPIK